MNPMEASAASAAAVPAVARPGSPVAAPGPDRSSRPAPAGDPGPTRGRRRRIRLHAISWIWVAIAEVLIVTVFSVMRPETFCTVDNLRNILTDSSILLLPAVGMTFVILTAGIDLSVGSILVFSSVIAAKAMTTAHLPALVGLLIAVACGAAWGLINGVVIAKGRVPAFIVTLGSLGVALGAAEIITKGVDVSGIPQGLVSTIGFGLVLGIPWLVIIAAVVGLIGVLTLTRTRFGLHTAAVGSNAEAARRSGVQVARVTICVYAVSGLLAGGAAFLSLARFSTTTISGHSTDNLLAISAVVLGGTSLFGGEGSVVGTIFGVLIPVTLQYGFTVLGVQAFWENVAVGIVLVVAVYIDQQRRRAAANT
jgi:ribose transport system permease protein